MQGDIQHLLINGSDIMALVPNYMRNNEHYIAIANSVNMLLNKLVNSMQVLETNQVVDTFNLVYIEMYEELYNLVYLPTDTLDDRRARIKERLKTVPPFTETFLKNKISTILGEGNFNLKVFPETYSIMITYNMQDIKKREELKALLHLTKPANLKLYEDMIFSNDYSDLTLMVESSEIVWNYVLDDRWKLDEKPFGTIRPKTIWTSNKNSGGFSMTNKFIEDSLRARLNLIKFANIFTDKGSYKIDEYHFNRRVGFSGIENLQGVAGILDVELDENDFREGGADNITRIVLTDANGDAYIDCELNNDFEVTIDTSGYMVSFYLFEKEVVYNG